MRKQINNSNNYLTDEEIQTLISSYSVIPMDKYLFHGWILYYMVVLFKEIKRKHEAKKEFMKREAERIVTRMTYRMVRYPESEAGWNLSPCGFFVVDYPVSKEQKKNVSGLSFGRTNDGMHINSVFAVPPAGKTRLKVLLDQDLRDNRHLYEANMVTKIHLSLVRSPQPTCEYCLKSLKSRRSTPDDVLLFPKSPTEYGNARAFSKKLHEFS
jgi:hypothetical protein